jgi:hypothetical protein
MTGTDSNTNARALGDAIAALLTAPAQMAAALVGASTARSSQGCEIPPPCWEPRPAGTCRIQVTPGGTATLRVHATNCDWTRRVVGITALGKIAAWLKFEPTSLIIDPQEQQTFIVTLHVPDSVKAGQSLSGPLLVRGCLDHFARIEVSVAECAGCASCDIHVKDCPDHIHHWYDHFYCPRPCRNLSTRDVKDG